MKVFINPGHCVGFDSGAVGNGLQEADVVLKIGRRVEKYLQAVGIQTKLFQFDGCKEIAYDANQWGADYFVSIHCNSYNSIAHGTETFCYAEGTTAHNLAKVIHNQMTKTFPELTDRGVKEAAYSVLRYTDMPAVLVETAFIDNVEDAKVLVEREDDFARAIARGVTDFLQSNKPIPDVIETPITSGNLSEHFDSSEFTCHHCGSIGNGMNPALIRELEKLRAIVKKPLHVNSGYRCPEHNAAVGGVPLSQHKLNNAADIAVPDGMSFEEFRRACNKCNFDAIGLYPDQWFIHLDVRDGGIGSRMEGYW